MQITLLNIFLTLVAVSTTVYSLQRLKKNRISVSIFFIRTTFWLLLVFVSFFPRITDVLANFFGVDEGANFALLAAVLVLFWLYYRLTMKIEQIERNITKIVSHLSERNT